jgi:preprotein translocase subunit YajC
MEGLFVLAQAQGGAGSAFVQLLPIFIIFAIFYFLLIAPMRKRQKALQAMVDALKKGDRVLTNGGIFGEVTAVEGAIVHLRIAENVRVRVAKSAISGLETPPQEEAKK